MTPFERSLSKLSENHKKSDPWNIQFMAAERVPKPLKTFFNSHNFVPCNSTMYDLLKAQRERSDVF